MRGERGCHARRNGETVGSTAAIAAANPLRRPHTSAKYASTAILRFPHPAKNGLGDENNQIRSVTDTTLVVWIEVVGGLISDSVAPRRFAYASVAVDSRTVG